ncbi:MAG: methylated-DNA--[protein]-cysteine S-methyltransferase [Gammaproteobacteria bacterium]|nr:methylated-DNA--[protein]-cysteine S-methyltransferase [Gammaproteobacteria bacterium]
MSDLSRLDAVLESPIGRLGIRTDKESLLSVLFLPKEERTIAPSSPLALEVQHQLSAYFNNKLTTFDLPLLIEGTSFQQKVLTALQSIAFGKTITYGQLAHGLATGPRAIGNACRRNPIPVIIPCHRVLSQNGIGGYSGATSGDLLTIKGWLLRHEADN